MQLHGALVLRPIEHTGTKFDQGGVQAQQVVLETEAVRAGEFAAMMEQLIEHAAVQLPGAVFVSIGSKLCELYWTVTFKFVGGAGWFAELADLKKSNVDA